MTQQTTMTELEPDIVDYVRQNFPSDAVPAALARLASVSTFPRIQRCIAFASRGHPWYFEFRCKTHKQDAHSHTAIMRAEYFDSQTRLYDFSRPIPQARIDDPFAGFDGKL
jgi:hypothetical protein